MSAPIPVLQALIHSPWYFRDESRPMDEQAMGDDWHVRTALALERAFPGRFALECWRPDWREPVERTACVSGLTCRIFPSRRAAFGKFLCEVSPAMFAALWRRARRERFVLHVHEMHSATGMLAAFLPSGAVKAAHTHGSPPVGLRLENAASPLKRAVLNALWPLEKFALARYRCLFAIADRELAYLRSLELPASKLTMGVDFHAFAPRARAEARARLSLPRDARIVLYCGRSFRLKGLDALLDAMDVVRSRLPGAFLATAGGLPQDELSAQVRARADRDFARVPYEAMPDLIAASDLVAPNVADPGLLGIGMATVEALAMDVPVLSSALGEFPGTDEERRSLGVHYRPGRDDLAGAIVEGLSLPAGARPRETARRFYDWPVIASRLAQAYEELWRG